MRIPIFAVPTSQTYDRQLSSLQPGTVYFYRIESMNAVTSVATDTFSFVTTDTSKLSY